jgi:hypothetical protein
MSKKKGAEPLQLTWKTIVGLMAKNLPTSHTNQRCNFPKDGHNHEAIKANNMGGCQENK